MNQHQARTLITRVIHDLHDAERCVMQLWEGQAWTVLGYEDWAALCAAEFQSLQELGKPARKALVAGMTARGMSTRAQAAAVGVTRQTIMNDQSQVVTDLPPDRVTGLDGKTYTRPVHAEDPRPTPSPRVPAEILAARSWVEDHPQADLESAYLAGWREAKTTNGRKSA